MLIEQYVQYVDQYIFKEVCKSSVTNTSKCTYHNICLLKYVLWMRAKKKGMRHWSRKETLRNFKESEGTLALISVWSEPTFQFQFENCIHSHKIWEAIWKKVCEDCPSIQNTFDWMKCKDRIEYLNRHYCECVKHNKKTGTDPQCCPLDEELDSVLG